MKVAAIVVAAGRGTRMGSELPKAFLPLGDVPILAHTLRALAAVPQITEMVVVVAHDDVDRLRRLLDGCAPWPLPIASVLGGAERQDSVAAGLEAISTDAELAVVHDGARPFVPPRCVSAAIAAAAEHGAAVLAVPSRDTAKLVDEERVVKVTPPRDTVWLAQTPQVFRATVLREAHAHARREGVMATDDAALVERLGVPVRVVPGDTVNVKITTPEDLRWAEWYLQTHAAPR